MRTSYHSVSSAQRLSSWLMAVLGLVAYLGVIYALTLVPIHFEIPLPHWAVAVIPSVTYGLLVLLWVRRPTIVRWLVGTAVLSGLHVLLTMSREPLSALLDPALAGRPLPWLLPPPLPEMLGLMLLMVPLRDVLRAPVRHARERVSSRSAASLRSRSAAAPRVPLPAIEAGSPLSEAPPLRHEPTPEAVAPTAAPPMAPAPPPPPVAAPVEEEPRRRRAAARAERRRMPAPPRPSRADVVLRIALDRIMGQLPPGTFLAPEDEVAASLSEPGYLKIAGELVVTQLAEGVARVAWSDIANQFPRHLIGLSAAQIGEHLGDGLRLPLDEVIGQLPHELFVADTPEVEIPGLDRIPVPFQPVEESEPARPVAPAAIPVSVAEPEPVTAVEPAPPMPAPMARPEPRVEARRVVEAPVPPVPLMPELPRPEPVRVEPPRPAPAPVEATPVAASAEATIRISFNRVAAQLPPEAFGVATEQVAERMPQPGVLLVPQSVVVPQLAEGLIRVSWDVVASQFPAGDLTMSNVEMAARLPEGIELPLDEVIRQVPTDLFLAAGPAPDVRGLESFPAPFQPLLSDPAPEPPAKPHAEPTLPTSTAPVPSLGLIGVEESPVPIAPVTEANLVAEEPVVAAAPPVVVPEPEPVIERLPEPIAAVEAIEEPREIIEPDPPRALAGLVVADAPPAPAARRAWAELVPAPPMPAAGPADIGEARRIAALLAPIASFDVSIQSVEGVTLFAMAAPTVAPETAVAAAGLALPLLTERRPPWPVDQITLRGPETALVLTPLGGPHERGPVLATAASRGRALALLELLCRRAAGERGRRSDAPAAGPTPAGGYGLAPAPVPSRVAGLASSLTAFGDVTASVLRDAESEAVFYFFLPADGHVPAVGAFAQDLQAVMRKAAGSGAVFRTAILRSGDTLLVIQPEEIGHGRSIVIVVGGTVTRPGLAYRQVERAATTLMSA